MPFARMAQRQILPSVSSSVDAAQVHMLVHDTNFTAATPPQYVSPHQELLSLHRPFSDEW